jgi:hypothetical protein
MRCLRIYATPDGESHFGDVDIPMTTTTPLFPNEALRMSVYRGRPESTHGQTRRPGLANRLSVDPAPSPILAHGSPADECFAAAMQSGSGFYPLPAPAPAASVAPTAADQPKDQQQDDSSNERVHN